ncbi:MAG: hypothetical protein Q4E05_06045 [Pseudoclavibacter sp.]|nr:hypothetical protein [Pseudoclavibacter sp.]
MRDETTRPYDFGASGADGIPTAEIELPRSPAAPAQTPPPAAETVRLPAAQEEATIALPSAGPAAPAPAPRTSVAPTPAPPPPPVQHLPQTPVLPGPPPVAGSVPPPAPRSADPGMFRRVLSSLLALPLHAAAVGLTGFALALAMASILLPDGVEFALGDALVSLDGSLGLTAGVLVAAAALAFLLAAATARVSAAGPALAGLLGMLFGIVALVWPGLLSGWIERATGLPDVLLELFASFTELVNAVVGVVALSSGATLLGAALAARGTRRAGWRRGAGGSRSRALV